MHNEIFNLLRAAVLGIIVFMLCCFCAAEKAQWEEAEREDLNTASPAETEEPSAPLVRISADSSGFAPSDDDNPDYIRYPLTEDERITIEAAVAAEAIGEDFKGQCLVAQCILNTAEATGKSPSEVIYEPGQYTTPDYENHTAVAEAVSAVFDDGFQVTGEPIRYFYAPQYCYSVWHEENLELVIEHGGHRFFKEK